MTTSTLIRPPPLADATQRPAWVPTELYPFTDRWATIDGHVVHYVDEGEGPTLLLLNGNPSWSFGWRDVIIRLRGAFRCIAPDYPGFGLSRAGAGFDDRPGSHSTVIEHLVDHLGLDRVTLVAYDWGGPIGLGFAVRRPELVGGLVLGNTWAWPIRARSVRLFSALLGGPTGALLVERLNVVLRVLLPRSLRRGPLTPAELAAYQGPFPPGQRRPMRVFPRELTAGSRFLRAVEHGLGRLVGRPVLLLWADGSAGLGDAELQRWLEHFPGSRVVRLRNVGRYLDEDAPDEVADAITAWWADVVDPPPSHAEGGRT